MTSTYKDHLKVLNQFLGKSDGKDKLCATIQYACLFLCAGEPGNVKKIQASVASARKVFRILKPLEALTPLITKPGFDTSTPRLMQLLSKVKAVCFSCYLAFDHVGWMGQAKLVSDENVLKRCQKISINSWLLGSLCSILHQCFSITRLIADLRATDEGNDLPSRQAMIRKQLHSQVLILIHACLQAMLAIGLLQYAPIGMRYVGLIGTMTSALNCYMLFPTTVPAAAPVPSDKEKKN